MEPLVIKTYGLLAEKLGATELMLPFHDDTQSVLEYLKNQYPFLKTSSFTLSVNKTIVQTNIVLNGREELALLPPFSGG